MKKLFKVLNLSFFVMVSLSVFSKSMDTIFISFDDKKYFIELIDIIKEETAEHNVDFDNISNRKINKKGNNILIIPQFVVRIDAINNNYFMVLDTVNPINSVIFFKNNKYLATLLFWNNDTIFCPKKIDNTTHFDCSKNIYIERFYVKSLNQILDTNPNLIFKITNIDRAWFFVNKSNKVYSLTYDLKYLKVKEYFEGSVIENHSINRNLKVR